MNLIGLDCEYFYQSPSGLAKPAKDVLVASKQHRPIFKEIGSDIADGGYWTAEVTLANSKLTEDGLALEVPVTPEREVDSLMQHLYEGLREAWKLADDNGYILSAAPLVYLDPRDLVDHPELRVLGCSPDKCLYDLSTCPWQDPRKITWRTGGFHIHFSISEIHKDMNKVQGLVMLLDCTLGLYDVLIESTDLGRQRRQMYGRAGKFRIQPWGVEYRTPSSVASTNPELTAGLLGLAKMVHVLIEDGYNPFEFINQLDFGRVVPTINNCDPEAAKQLFSNVSEFFGVQAPAPPKNYIMEAWK